MPLFRFSIGRFGDDSCDDESVMKHAESRHGFILAVHCLCFPGARKMAGVFPTKQIEKTCREQALSLLIWNGLFCVCQRQPGLESRCLFRLMQGFISLTVATEQLWDWRSWRWCGVSSALRACVGPSHHNGSWQITWCQVSVTGKEWWLFNSKFRMKFMNNVWRCFLDNWKHSH